MHFTRKRMLMTAFILSICLLIVGCSTVEQSSAESETNENNEEIETEKEEKQEEIDDIIPYNGEPSPSLDYIYTTDPVMALTLNGLIEADKMDNILDKLDEHNIQATFFLDEKQLTEHTDIAHTITNHGHTIENSVYAQKDLKELNYETIYKNIITTNNLIEDITGEEPDFTRTKPWKQSDDLELITAQLNMDAVIGHVIRPTDKALESEESLAHYIERALSRGGIISLDTEDYPLVLAAIDDIVDEAEQIDYHIIELKKLVAMDQVRKPLEDIDGHDLIQKNINEDNAPPHVLYSQDTTEKTVALTFDDYGSDKTVLQILDILDENDIQSSFFLKAKNVKDNPNLAKLILDRGHEIANHSYGHRRSTELTSEELQEDLTKAHQIITEAIQEKPTMLFRPPFGNTDEAAEKAMAQVGFDHIAMYDISSYDWNAEYTIYDVLNRVMSNIKPGSVIVMHMSDDIKNIDTLPAIIEHLKSEGYTFVKMSEWFDE